jgi:hypothetical protein
MSSALGDKKGRVADSSDLTRMRRNASEIAAYATYTGITDIKRMRAQQGTTKGILSILRGAITITEASTTGRTIDPIDGSIAWAPYSVPVYSSFSMIPNFNDATFVSKTANGTEPGNYIVTANNVAGYSNGTYTAVGSSFASGSNTVAGAWRAFIGLSAEAIDGWITRFRYDASGAYTGSINTTVAGDNISGEYIEITTPNNFVLSSYRVITESPVIGCPPGWVLAGSSNGGTTFNLVDTQTGLVNTDQTHVVGLSTNSNAYSTYRLIIPIGTGAPNNEILSWQLYQTVRTG